MKKNIYFYLISLIITFYAASAYAACNVDLTGTWNTSETVYASACGGGTYPDSDTVTIVQTTDNQGVCNLTVTGSNGIPLTGTIDGNTIQWTGSFPADNGGTTTITSSSFTASDSTGCVKTPLF